MTHSNPNGNKEQLGLPPRDPSLEQAFAQTLKEWFGMQRARYNENPPRTYTFSDLYLLSPYAHDSFIEKAERPINRAFAYRLNSMKSDDDSLIPLPREKFWCLLRPMAGLLLSDRRVQHYTVVYSIDYSKETIDLLDNWPDKIFLKEGLNTRGIQAQIIEIENLGKLVRITRSDFEKVIIGAMTVESDTFHEHLLKVIPSGIDDPRFMLALSVGTLGDRISTENPATALTYAVAAFELTLEMPDKMLQMKIAKQLLYAVLFADYWLNAEDIDHETESKVKIALAAAERLLSVEYSDLTAEALSDNQIIRLGQMAYNIYRLHDAETYFSMVIERSPDNPMGYFGRAKTRNRMVDHEGVIADSTACIRLIQRSTGDNQDTPTSHRTYVYQLLDRFEKSYEVRKFNYMLPESYVLRGNAHGGVGNYSSAEFDGRNAISMKPKDFQGYMIIAASLNERGRHYQSLPFYSMVIQLPSPPDLKKSLHMFMKSVIDQAIQSDPEMKHGFINQDTLLFRSKEDCTAFYEVSQTGRYSTPGENSYVCILPKKTYVLIHGEKNSRGLNVEADVQLIRSPKWSPTVSEEEIEKGFVRGVIFDSDVDLSPQDFWQTYAAGLLAEMLE